MLDVKKIFYIESLNQFKDVIVYNNKIPGTPRFGIPDIYESYVYYRDGSDLYVQEVGKSSLKTNDDQKKLYNSLLSKAQGKINKLGTFIFKSPRAIGIPDLADANIIEKVEIAPNSNITIFDIVMEIEMPK